MVFYFTNAIRYFVFQAWQVRPISNDLKGLLVSRSGVNNIWEASQMGLESSIGKVLFERFSPLPHFHDTKPPAVTSGLSENICLVS